MISLNGSNSADFRVLFTPFYDANPYQEMYESALEDRGVSVFRHKDPIPFSLPIVAAVRNRIDIVHLHWIHPFFLFGSKRWLYKIPGSKIISIAAALIFLAQILLLQLICEQIVWTVHNLHNHEKRYLALDHWVGTQVASQADVVQVWDKQTAKEVTETYNVPQTKIVELPHGNFDLKYDSYSGPDPRTELGVDGYKQVYLFFGMIRPYKNIPTLIETFQAISSPSDSLLVAGNPMDEQIRTSVEDAAANADNVYTHLEYIPDPNVPMYFAAADICVFPYDDIFNSGSVILAMTFGKPFVAPKKGAIPSIAPEGNILYKDLNKGLKTARKISADALESVGNVNRRAALTDHSWDDIADRTCQIYQIANEH